MARSDPRTTTGADRESLCSLGRGRPQPCDGLGLPAVFLDADQRKALIAAASPAAARFLRGLELTGARPKELTPAIVADFEGTTLRLAHRKGRPAKLRRRHVVLSTEAIAFFREQSRDKLPNAPLLTEDGETSWRRHVWARAVRAAIENSSVRFPQFGDDCAARPDSTRCDVRTHRPTVESDT